MSYPVGTICIGQNFIYDTHRNGMQCVITEPLRLRKCTHWATGVTHDFVYWVRWSDGIEKKVEHRNLKRKDWDDEEKRAEDRQKVRNLYDALEKAAELAGETVDQEEGVK